MSIREFRRNQYIANKTQSPSTNTKRNTKSQWYYIFVKIKILIKSLEMSLVVQWLRHKHPVQMVWVWSLVKELRYHIPKHKIEQYGKKTKQNKTKNSFLQNPGPNGFTRKFSNEVKITSLLHTFLKIIF